MNIQQTRDLVKRARALIFDMDGTVVPSGDVWARGLDAVLSNLGYDNLDLNFPKGSNMSDKWRYIMANNPVQLSLSVDEMATITRFQVGALFNEKPTSGLPLFLESNLTKRTALATNANRDITLFLLMQLGLLNNFEVVITADEMHTLAMPLKPDPEMFLYAAQRLCVTPEECVVFGDTHSDAEAAHACGMPVIIIGRMQEDFPKGTFFVENFHSFNTRR